MPGLGRLGLGLSVPRGGGSGVAAPVTATDLVTALGGDASVQAIYDVRNNVEQTVDQGGGIFKSNHWDDARGSVGFGPTITASGTSSGPLYNTSTKDMVFNGTNDLTLTAASALFDLSGAISDIYIGSITGTPSKYAMGIDGGGARYFYINTETTGTIVLEDGRQVGAHQDSTIAGGATKRVVAVGKNGTTGVSIDVPNHARVTGTASGNMASGNNQLVMGAHTSGGSTFVGLTVRARIILARQVTPADLALITAWAVAQHGATPA